MGSRNPETITLEARLKKARTRSKLSPGRLENSDWALSESVLRHRLTNYFSIEKATDEECKPDLRIRQEDGAEVVLLFRKNQGGSREFLIQERAEPGLIGKVVYTTTIQSTWQNLRAEHKGSTPPLAEYVNSDREDVTTVIDIQQYDWLDLYWKKHKRYRVLEVTHPPAISQRHIWVSEISLKELALRQNLLSVDLMATLGLLIDADDMLNWNGVLGSRRGTHNLRTALSQSVLRIRRYRFKSVLASGSSNRAVMVDFSTTDREVLNWTQPLMDVGGIRNISLELFQGEQGEFVICQPFDHNKESPVIDSLAATTSASSNHLSDCRSCGVVRLAASGEGGRFLWHQVQISVTVHKHICDKRCPDCKTVAGFADSLRSPLMSSVSHRLAAFALWALYLE
jgi:hypothetical protein